MQTVIYNCKKCKVGKRVDYQDNQTRGIWITACGGGKPTEYGGDTVNGLCHKCGRMMVYGVLKGIKNESVPCDGRCTGARGHNCECSCGGANHGIDN
jgi:hypothetical protein